MRDIGRNIKDFRIEANMTQDELAQRLFVTRQTVSNYENGNSRPDVDMLLKMAEVFGVEVNTVIYGPQVDPEQKRRRRQAGVLIGITIMLGILFVAVTNVVGDRAKWIADRFYVYFYSFPIICDSWMKPAWLLLVGWVFVHGLCEYCGTRTIKPPTSHYIKWGIIALIVGYVALILPHSVWFVLEDIKSIQRHRTGFVGEYTSSFSVFHAWDWVAIRILHFSKPRDLEQIIFAVLDYLPLPLGGLLRLCREPKKQKRPEAQPEK